MKINGMIATDISVSADACTITADAQNYEGLEALDTRRIVVTTDDGDVVQVITGYGRMVSVAKDFARGLAILTLARESYVEKYVSEISAAVDTLTATADSADQYMLDIDYRVCCLELGSEDTAEGGETV